MQRQRVLRQGLKNYCLQISGDYKRIKLFTLVRALQDIIIAMTKDKNLISLSANSNYIPGLDGVRAISILIVLVSHFGLGKIVPGGFGVTIFFFVSGFLITRLLVGEQNKTGGNINLPNFYIRRFLRLMPALYAFVAFTYFFSLLFGVKATTGQTFSALLYFANYYDVIWQYFGWAERIVPWGHLWSLAVEEHFYLLFPFALAVFGRNQTSRLKLILTLIIGVAIWRYFAFTALKLPETYTYSTTDCRIESIAWGCLLAVLFDGFASSKKRLNVLIGWHWVGVGIGIILFSLLYRDETFRATMRYSVQGIGIFILILNLYAFQPMGFALNILELKPIRFFGRLSYSLYLWHYPVLWGCYRMIGEDVGDVILPTKLLIVAIIGSLGLALLSYYFIERPFFALRKKFGGKPVEEMRA